jgi:hypothetical protein
MGRLFWPLALVGTFIIGWAAASVVLKGSAGTPDVEQLQQTVRRLQDQVGTLQARLRAREDLAASRPSAGAGAQAGAARGPYSGPGSRFLAGAVTEERALADRTARGGDAAQAPGGSPADRAPSRSPSAVTAGSPPTVEAALDRFYRYLEATKTATGREGWRQARELVNELRAMGDTAGQALMQVLSAGNDSDERRAAARLLGTLQIPQALPLLRDIIQREDDLLLRRAAAAGLRQLQTPESLPVMERLLTNPGEDRFIRLSAAVGLAQSGKPMGVAGLTQIFDEATADGRGRDTAFRALVGLKDERPLPFMRQVVTSQVEPGYRLQAIKYLTAQGDQQALGALQAVMNSPKEQPSIRDAATQAYTAIRGK